MTKIEWTDEQWAPVVGCTPVSAGCANCWAARQASRGMHPTHRGLTRAVGSRKHWTGEVRCLPERLDAPLRWRKPRRIAVALMGDLFHPDVPTEFILSVFGVMAACPQHTFQVLTKRPERMLAVFEALRQAADPPDLRVQQCARAHLHERFPLHEVKGTYHARPWPLPNVWLGVSVEDQRTADERIPLLLQTPAAVRFVSAEPLLGPVDLRQSRGADYDESLTLHFPLTGEIIGDGMNEPVRGPRLDWVIVGGESGPGARPCDVAWVYSILRQTADAGTACFVKQMGSTITGVNLWGPPHSSPPRREGFLVHWKCLEDNTFGLCNRKGGDPEEWPEDLRVREFPEVRP